MKSCMFEKYLNDSIRRERKYRSYLRRERAYRKARIARRNNPVKGFNVLVDAIVIGILAIVGLDFLTGKGIDIVWLIILGIALMFFVKVIKVK